MNIPTFTIKEFASKQCLDIRTARRKLSSLEDAGSVRRVNKDGAEVLYVVSNKTKWHDPFNKCKRGNHEKIVASLLAQYIKRKG